MHENELVMWHEIIQTILDEDLGYMSGKKVKRAKREEQMFFRADYVCYVEGEEPKFTKKSIVRPFDHLKNYNIIEYKSFHESLNEETFRYYIGRALYFEGNPRKEENRQGKTTLTMFTTRKPQTLIDSNKYAIEKINDWKYRSFCFPDLDVYILVQKGMRDKREGEALALLQALEGEKKKQIKIWKFILNQNLENAEKIRKIIKKISKELYMNVIEEAKKEERQEVAKEIALNLLKDKIEISTICRATGLSKEEIIKLKKEHNL